MATTEGTRWNHLLSYFWGGAFLANTIPHLVAGVSGAPFQSPFASPPGEGLSPAMTNTLWGLANFFVAYLLLVRVGRFDLRENRHAITFGVGFAGMAVMLAHHFARFHGGL
jgi:hypothetical protein